MKEADSAVSSIQDSQPIAIFSPFQGPPSATASPASPFPIQPFLRQRHPRVLRKEPPWYSADVRASSFSRADNIRNGFWCPRGCLVYPPPLLQASSPSSGRFAQGPVKLRGHKRQPHGHENRLSDTLTQPPSLRRLLSSLFFLLFVSLSLSRILSGLPMYISLLPDVSFDCLFDFFPYARLNSGLFWDAAGYLRCRLQQGGCCMNVGMGNLCYIRFYVCKVCDLYVFSLELKIALRGNHMLMW